MCREGGGDGGKCQGVVMVGGFKGRGYVVSGRWRMGGGGYRL